MDYLSWPDYLILAAFLLISVGIGVYHSLTGGRQRTTSEFIMANRSLKVIPTTISLLVSFQSAIVILGMTAEMYSYGSLYMTVMIVAFTLAIILTMQVAIPWLYPLKLVSINEVRCITLLRSGFVVKQNLVGTFTMFSKTVAYTEVQWKLLY